MPIKKFDVIVIGAGSGLNISSYASKLGLKTAIIESGPMGGTCLNRGCVPSKILIHHADIAEIINNANKFHISVNKPRIDFKSIVNYTSNLVDKDAKEIEAGIKEDKNTTLFKGIGKFVGKKIIKINNKEITANKIFIVAGTRPFIPPIKGINKVKYITSTEALRLTNLPKTITFLGGGYITAELAHFFGSLGSKINIILRSGGLIRNEDSEISQKFTEIFSKKYNLLLNYDILEVNQNRKEISIKIKSNNKTKIIKTDQLIVATGRIPNSDTLEVKKSGIKTDKNNFIHVNDYLETNIKNVYALGDIAGKFMFKHSANLEASYAILNAFSSKKIKVDYSAMPHAIFSSPQVAAVGYTEDELKQKKIPYIKSKYYYVNTAMGTALKDKDGFVKILVHKTTKKILGCHILGADASILIHEVIVAMKSGTGTIDNIKKSVHVHPALSEVVQRAALKIKT